MIKAIRGATTSENTRDSIISNTKSLLNEILAANNLETDQIISALFSCTKDLNAAYPAVAARGLGMTQASLMCVQEMDVPGSLPMCIRVQITAVTSGTQGDAKHIYMKEARALRPDLIDNT